MLVAKRVRFGPSSVFGPYTRETPHRIEVTWQGDDQITFCPIIGQEQRKSGVTWYATSRNPSFHGATEKSEWREEPSPLIFQLFVRFSPFMTPKRHSGKRDGGAGCVRNWNSRHKFPRGRGFEWWIPRRRGVSGMDRNFPHFSLMVSFCSPTLLDRMAFLSPYCEYVSYLGLPYWSTVTISRGKSRYILWFRHSELETPYTVAPFLPLWVRRELFIAPAMTSWVESAIGFCLLVVRGWLWLETGVYAKWRCQLDSRWGNLVAILSKRILVQA